MLLLTMRRAKIVATLGPATDDREAELIAAGLDVARLNFSHGSPDDHARRCSAIRDAAASARRTIAVLMDVQGPKIRVGALPEDGVQLKAGDRLTVVAGDVRASPGRVGCTYDALAKDVQAGDTVYVDDGRIRLRVREVVGDEVRAEVEEGGRLTSHKGINLPGVRVSAPSITAKDADDLAFGIRELGVDYVALSFIRSGADV